MKLLRKRSIAVVLTLMLASSTLAGEMSTGRTGDISTTIAGDMSTGITASDITIQTVLNLYQSLLAVL
jgi:hypothetical protein